MPVFFLSPECIVPPTISVTGELLIHLRDSLRTGTGEIVWFGDGAGHRYRTKLTARHKQTMTGQILEVIAEPPRQAPSLILGQSLLKGEKMEWVIQKATELGVREIVPLQSRHSIVQIRPDRVDTLLTRWQRIALEAAQQSEQWRVPRISAPQAVAPLLTRRTPKTQLLMLTERQDGGSLRTVELLQDIAGSLLILTGPEGGWSHEEMDLAAQAQIEPITLGPHILRAETASIAAITILQSRLGLLG